MPLTLRVHPRPLCSVLHCPGPLAPTSLSLLAADASPDAPSRAPFPSALQAQAHSNQLILKTLHRVPQLLPVQLTQQQFLLHGRWWRRNWLRDEAPPSSNWHGWGVGGCLSVLGLDTGLDSQFPISERTQTGSY